MVENQLLTCHRSGCFHQTFSYMFQNFAVKFSIDGLLLADKFSINNAMDIKKDDDHALD